MDSARKKTPAQDQQLERKRRGRRKLVKALTAGGGGVLLTQQWVKPIVDLVVVPLHAQVSPPPPPPPASPITVPSGLNPGDTYYLVFVTAGTRDAASSSIGDYDAFVTAQANLDEDLLALGTTWKVIGSTADESAAAHLGLITSPIYNLAGQLIATGSADLWFDQNILHPVAIDQHGNTSTTEVWTGSTALGTPVVGHELGTERPVRGASWTTQAGWMVLHVHVLGGTNLDPAPFYAIGGPLTVPAAAV